LLLTIAISASESLKNSFMELFFSERDKNFIRKHLKKQPKSTINFAEKVSHSLYEMEVDLRELKNNHRTVLFIGVLFSSH
jgi:hypothetical protein